ncbi:hypothetical protein FHW84_002823 [Dyella sp. SG562]|uniref:hypothetical protein n=1 Tax=Dyella sp. SG562 TaxID=2587017 RepID=UPI00142325B4|nr:hypothetical protein [Dyella sp. SG562]NII74238.1 hypothetical protein [Dyella sp. SG562]
MTLTDQMRDLLRRAAAPLNLDQIMEQLPHANRQTASQLLHQRKHAGEIVVCIEDGKACFALSEGFRASPRSVQKHTDKAAGAPAASDSPEPAAVVVSTTVVQAVKETLANPIGESALSAVLQPNGRKKRRALDKPQSTAVVGAERPAEDGQTLEALRKAVTLAEVAREAYIDTVVDQRFYGWLQESVRASREALAAFERSAR